MFISIIIILYFFPPQVFADQLNNGNINYEWYHYITNQYKIDPKTVLKTANKIKIAIIDTGIDRNICWLDTSNTQIYYVAGDKNDNKHGTLISSILASNNKYGVRGVIPGIKIQSIKVGDSQNISQADLIKGISRAIELKPDIISMSLSTYYDNNQLHDVIKRALKENILVVASVGNDYYRGKSFPASYSEVMAVTAVDQDSDRLFRANTNNDISVAAPGKGIIAIDSKGNKVNYSGTSAAVPFVVGLAAILKSEDPSLNPNEIKNIIQMTATDLGDIGKDCYYGYGLIDFNKALYKARLKASLLDKNGQSYLLIKVADKNGDLINGDYKLCITIQDYLSSLVIKRDIIIMKNGCVKVPYTSNNNEQVTITSVNDDLVPYILKY